MSHPFSPALGKSGFGEAAGESAQQGAICYDVYDIFIRQRGSMHLFETLRTSVRSLLSNKTRSVLTMLGVVIGTAAVIAMADRRLRRLRRAGLRILGLRGRLLRLLSRVEGLDAAPDGGAGAGVGDRKREKARPSSPTGRARLWCTAASRRSGRVTGRMAFLHRRDVRRESRLTAQGQNLCSAVSSPPARPLRASPELSRFPSRAALLHGLSRVLPSTEDGVSFHHVSDERGALDGRFAATFSVLRPEG